MFYIEVLLLKFLISFMFSHDFLFHPNSLGHFDWLRLDCCSIWKTQTRSIQNSDSQMELSERVLGTVAAGAGLSMCAFWYLGLKVHLKDDVLWLPCTNDVNFMIGWEQNESLLMIFSHEWPRYLTLVLTVVVVVVLLRLNDRLVKAKWIHHDNST